MRILVDSLNLGLSSGTGIATYTENFIKNAVKCGHEVDLVLSSNGHYSKKAHRGVTLADALTPAPEPGGILRPVKLLYGEIRTCFAPRVNNIPLVNQEKFLPVRQAWQVPRLYRNAMMAFKHFDRFTELDIPGIDVAHWTSPLPVRVRNAINIYTIHDMIPATMPEFITGNIRLNRRLFRRIADIADFIFTVSENSKKDIVNFSSCDENKIINTYQTIEKYFWTPPSSVPAALPDNLRNKGYFLFFGAVEPKKNVGRIIAAHRKANVTLPLVLVSSTGWGSQDVWKEIHDYCNEGNNRCIVMKYLPRHGLVNVIANAKSVVFPSLYEGFGLPVLEAMALGTPVIGSTAASLPEVIGDGGLLVDPLDTAALTQAMEQMEHVPGLADSLAEKGRRQANRFSPEAYRHRLSEALTRCADQLRISGHDQHSP
ncbi:glycosyltransferase family 1 protein [Komagataeibacter sp. FNDCF1]|uniref:glycosyltransferase family 4 protein n=1 Tax=Komagataeibacter sp. FNDCF1 TaxID=2878681 RepID=UPI001E34F226|nr:glycosyltransferase family 4 protein [Komagataeibacter sp. FNDCF1]